MLLRLFEPTCYMLLCVHFGISYNILGVFPNISKSHSLAGAKLLQQLAADGHNVSFVNPYPFQLSNVRHIHVAGVGNAIKDHESSRVWFDQMNPIHAMTHCYQIDVLVTNFTLNHPEIIKLLSSKDEHFDVIIVDLVFANALLGLGQHFDAPIVAFSSYPTWSVASLAGEPNLMSYIPNMLLSLTENMPFGQRLDNALLIIFESLYNPFYTPYQEILYNEIFQRNDKPTYQEVIESVSIVLLNQLYSTSGPRPHMPNMIDVGGIHIAEPNPLPDDIQEFVDGAEHGVIYLSLGSYVRSSKFPPELFTAIIITLSQLKERVLWKWDDTDIPSRPPNVMMKSWFPQNDVLAHSSVKLFITNGGQLSIAEATYHGLPMVGIPIFGDQSSNLNRAVFHGLGVVVDYTNLTQTSLTWAIYEVVHNRKYTQQAENMAIRYRDHPIAPIKLAVYWVDYVARHRGAKNVQSAGRKLHFLQYYSLDVVGLLIGAVVLWVYLIWIAFVSICSLCRTYRTRKSARVCMMCLRALSGNRPYK